MPIPKVPSHRDSKAQGSAKSARFLRTDELRAWARSPEEGRAASARIDSEVAARSKYAAFTTALDKFTRAYVEAALFSSTDDEGAPLENKYSFDDIAPSTLEAMVRDCQQFQQDNAEALDEMGDVQGGHDFWLTRNGHGAGFWDGDWPVNGKALTMASKKFKEAELYVGDDGYIYQGGTEVGEPVPPREEYNPTPEELADLKAMGIQGSQKMAVYAEEQWEDILQKKGYTKDESTDSAWEDTLYVNAQYPDVQVLIHESAEPYYIVELNGDMIEQGTDPEKLWNALERAPGLYRKTIKHDREMNDSDKALMAEMGVIAHVKSGLLRKKEPKMAFDFNQQSQRQYDYEASGNDVVLISPANTTKLLEGDEARNFWVGLDQIEGAVVEDAPKEEYDQRVQTLIRSYFERDLKAASTSKFVVQVDASGLKKNASVTYVRGLEMHSDGSVDKLKFTSSKARAEKFSRTAANKLLTMLSDFKLTGTLVKEG